jgi:hypothetical protein
MITLRFLKIAAVMLCIVVESFAIACPDYANAETKRVIEAMVEAHGGIERWRAAPSISFDDTMHMETHEKGQFGWWVAHEVIDQETRQVYQEWPMEDSRLGFDGEKVWSQNWQQANPTAMMVHFFYYFVNLPWLTQDDGVILSAVEESTWEGIDGELYKVTMSFDGPPAAVGKSAKDTFVLYIDPETYRLVSYQYGTGFGPFIEMAGMPKGSVFGPMWRVITRYEEVGGLLFPSAFHTMPGPDGKIIGDHVITNIDISTPFDTEKAAVPADAVVFAGPLHTD